MMVAKMSVGAGVVAFAMLAAVGLFMAPTADITTFVIKQQVAAAQTPAAPEGAIAAAMAVQAPAAPATAVTVVDAPAEVAAPAAAVLAPDAAKAEAPVVARAPAACAALPGCGGVGAPSP